MAAVRPYIPERRSGFDRRHRYPVLGRVKDEPAALAVLLSAFVVLSVLDLQFTTHSLGAGVAVEGNPVMASLFMTHPAAAAAFKLGTTLAVAAAIWRFRRYRHVLGVSVLAFGLYSALALYHMLGLRLTLG